MTSRPAMAVVVDLMQTGLTVEQQALVGELYASLATRSYERERKRAQRDLSRTVPDKESTKESIYNNKTPLEGVQGKPLSRTSGTPPSESPLFLQFWEVFPRKIAKGAAAKAFRHALKRSPAEPIIEGARRYAATNPDPQYTKHPATWLNADCWLDEPAKKPGMVLNGPWKPIEREAERPKIPEEERQRNLAKLRGALKQSIDMEKPGENG